jgi:hypothetical protein
VGNLGSSSEAILRDLQYSGSDRITTMIVVVTDVPQAEDSRRLLSSSGAMPIPGKSPISVHLQLWIFDLKELDRLKIVTPLAILPRLQSLDQHGFHHHDYYAGFHAGVR